MYSYIGAIENNLTASDKKLLSRIWAPTAVGRPPDFACRAMCVTREGEIRVYGMIDKKHHIDEGTRIYLSSKDAGLSWKR